MFIYIFHVIFQSVCAQICSYKNDGFRENEIFAATALTARCATAILPSGFRLW